LNKSSQSALIQLARNVLYEHYGLSVDNRIDLTTFPELTKKSGLFVSLYLRGELHGCVGHVVGDMTRAAAVRKMAVAAATMDPRFYPLEAEVIPQVTIEISLLSPFELTRDFSAIKVGRHGLAVEVEGQQGLLLPQVADRYKWTAEQFLEETCIKAGLPRDAYLRPDAKVSRFTATVIKE